MGKLSTACQSASKLLEDLNLPETTEKNDKSTFLILKHCNPAENT